MYYLIYADPESYKWNCLYSSFNLAKLVEKLNKAVDGDMETDELIFFYKIVNEKEWEKMQIEKE